MSHGVLSHVALLQAPCCSLFSWLLSLFLPLVDRLTSYDVKLTQQALARASCGEK